MEVRDAKPRGHSGPAGPPQTERENTMRKSAKIISALSVAGLAVAAGSAFTASNTLPASSIKGYGQTVSTGATITGMTFNTDATDGSKLESVVFVSTTDVTLNTVTMTLKQGATVVVNAQSCTKGAFAAGEMTITCDPANLPLNDFNTTGLTVL